MIFFNSIGPHLLKFISIILLIFSGCASRTNLPRTQKKTSTTNSKMTPYRPALPATPPTASSIQPSVITSKTPPTNAIPAQKNDTELSLTLENAITNELKPSVIEPTTSPITYDVDTTVIGAILPLTGKNSNIGQHALNSIRMGLDLNNPNNKLRLALFDSKSNPEFAANGVDKLIKEDKVIALLGGFTAREATSIAERAEFYKMPYIGFSQKSGLTNIGDYIFRNSITPEMQVDKLVQYATEKLSAKKFAILFPNDTYGVEFSNIFWDHVLARGGSVTAAQTYDPKETDFSEAIQKLVGTYYVEARAEEYKKKVEELKTLAEAAQKKESKKDPKKIVKQSTRDRWSHENILEPVVDFDVLFIPDSSRALGQIMAFMKYNEVTTMTYLGTNIWSAPDLPKRATVKNTKLYFVDALDISDGAKASDFFKDYLTLYAEEPTLVEVQTYEAAKILKEQLNSGALSRDELAENLRELGRIKGVTGELRMSSQREIERPIHVLTLDSGFIKKIE